jgi:hypothetical protein
LVAESFSVAELGLADFNGEPRENAKRQIAFDGQVPAGGILDTGECWPR